MFAAIQNTLNKIERMEEQIEKTKTFAERYTPEDVEGYILVREHRSSCEGLSEEDLNETREYNNAVQSVCELIGEKNICFRITFASTVLVEKNINAGTVDAEPRWVPFDAVHGTGTMESSNLGSIALPCALLAPASDSLPWLAAEPVPQCRAPLCDAEAEVVDRVVQQLFKRHTPLFVLRSKYDSALQKSTRLRANGIYVLVPPTTDAKKMALASNQIAEILDSLDQSGIEAYAGPTSIRLCFGRVPASKDETPVEATDDNVSSSAATQCCLFLMRPTSVHSVRCWLPVFAASLTEKKAAHNIRLPFSRDVSRWIAKRDLFSRSVGPILFDQDNPMFFVREKDCFRLFSPSEIVSLAPLVANGEREQQCLLDFLDQADAGLERESHKAFVTKLGVVIDRLTRPQNTERADIIAKMREQLLVEANGDAIDEKRAMAEMAAQMRIYSQERRQERRNREKALEQVCRRLTESICSTGMTSMQGNLRVALRSKKIQANVERATDISIEDFGCLLEESCGEQGVLFLPILAPNHFVPALQARSDVSALFEQIDQLLSPASQTYVDIGGNEVAAQQTDAFGAYPFDALTAGAIIEHTSQQPHALQQEGSSQGQPAMLSAPPTGNAIAKSVFVVPLLDTLVNAHDLGKAFNWIDETNKECVAIPRILQAKAIASARVMRESDMHVLPSDEGVRRVISALCLRAAQQIASRITAVDGGDFRGTATESFNDTTRGVLRGLVGWAVLALTAGTNPQSMVFQILCSTVGRPEKPRSPDDWTTYAQVVRLLSSTGWETRTAQTACARILARCLNSSVQSFVRAENKTAITQKIRHFADLCYEQWIGSGLPKTRKRTRYIRLMAGTYDSSTAVATVAAAFLEKHPEYGGANLAAASSWSELEGIVKKEAESLKRKAKKKEAGHQDDCEDENDEDAPATSDNASVHAALLAASVTKKQLQEMSLASNNLLCLNDASTDKALQSVAVLCKTGTIDNLLDIARCAGFGEEKEEIRRTLRQLTEFLFSKRHSQQAAQVEEEAVLAVLNWLREEKQILLTQTEENSAQNVYLSLMTQEANVNETK